MINPIYAETLFNYLYANINGYDISSASRPKTTSSKDLLYGEIPFATWKKIVEQANPKDGAIFFDLGSGTGRVVIESHLLFNFRKSIGIELVKGLHDKACEIAETFTKIIKPQINDSITNRELLFINDNILNVDIYEADFILLPHPFKSENDFLALEERFLKQLKPKTKIVTFIRPLRNRRFKGFGGTLYNFSWGKSTAYFFEV